MAVVPRAHVAAQTPPVAAPAELGRYRLVWRLRRPRNEILVFFGGNRVSAEL